MLRHKGCQEADGAEQWANVLSLLKDAEHTQDRKKARWIDVLGRSTDKPRMEHCEEQSGTIRYIRALQGHSHGVAIHPNLFSSKQVPFVWKEHLFHRTVLPTANQSLRYGLCAGGLSLRSTRQACFCSALNPQELSSRQRAIDWKGLDDEPRMVQYKQSNRRDR